MIDDIKGFSHLMNVLKKGLLWVDESGKILQTNQRIDQHLGYDPEELTDRTIFEVNPNLSVLSWKKKWKLYQSGEWTVEQTELMTRSEVIYPVKVIAFVDPDSNICQYIVENLHEKHRYKDMLELTSTVGRIGSWECDLVTDKVVLTEQSLHLLATEDAFLNRLSLFRFIRRLSGLIYPEDVQALFKKLRASMRDGAPFELELGLKSKSQNGGNGRLQINAAPQLTEGTVAKILGTLQDISKIANRSEEMYLAMNTLEQAQEMVYWIKQDASLVYVNDAVVNHLGYSKTELKQMKVFDFDPNYPKEKWPASWQFFRKSRTADFETTNITKDGREISVMVSLTHVSFKGEEFLCAMSRNVTGKKKREEIIELTYHTLNQSNELIFWIRPNGKIIYTNDSARDRFNYSKEELLDMSFHNLFPEMTDRTFQDYWQQLLDEQQIEFQLQAQAKDGRRGAVEVNMSYLTFLEKDCACVTIRSIEERRRKAAELRSAFEEIRRLKEKIEQEKIYLQEEISTNYDFANIISRSPRYKQVLQQVAQVAETNATVLITGETGTGKELLARAVHNYSQRNEKPMIKVNCAALPENLIESELFGHEKGAFTGAYKQKIGRFELADQGTIFLDEIGELPIELQSKLLRVLQEGEFERLGSTRTTRVDVRVIAATNRNLEQQVADGKFREDLYYRLHVFPIHNIPLRERPDDIPLLVNHFIKKHSERIGRKITQVQKADLKRLARYDFPGNVRELENIIERAMIFSKEATLNLEDVIPDTRKKRKGQKGRFQSFEEIQRAHILKALEKCHWKVTGKGGAAELLQMNGKTLASKMRKLDIRREDHLMNS